jgi:cell division protease FtsH
MKKLIQYLIIFIVVASGIVRWTTQSTIETWSQGEQIIVNIKKTVKSDLSNVLQRYSDGEFQRMKVNNGNSIQWYTLLDSQPTTKPVGVSGTVVKNTYIVYQSDLPPDTSLTDLGLDLDGKTQIVIENESMNPFLSFVIEQILPIVLFVAVLGFLMRGIGWGKWGMMWGFPFKMSIGREKKDGDKKTTFADVAGMEEVKGELMEIVDYLKNSDKYTKVGARIPKWVLLYGQPGTGKTLLARAVAGEAGVPFISASGSEFMEMLVGMGAAKVRELFGKAKAQSPAIIFIDEIDAIGKKRGQWWSGGHQEQEQTLNQILTEMDGFETDTKVIVIAATNRPDTLDSALLRSGRFDRKIMVSAPTLEERVMIIQYYLKDKKLEDWLNLMSLAKRMSGFAGADIENIINEAALKLAKDGREEITAKDIDYGLEKVVMWPEKKARTLNESEREIVTYHELGHAICAHRLPHWDPVEKISIVSRGQALWVTWIMPAEDRYLKSKVKFLDEITGLLGGRAAEEIFFGVDAITTGASNDFERVTAMATDMIVKYGMDPELGTMQFISDNDYNLTKPYSESTAVMIDSKIRAIVQACYAKAKELIVNDKELMIKLAKLLDAKEYLTREEFEELMTCDLSTVDEKVTALISEYDEEMKIAEEKIEKMAEEGKEEKTHE